MKAMLDSPNDIWAAAMVIYQVLTSASHTERQDRFLRKAIQEEQALWVSVFTGHWPHRC